MSSLNLLQSLHESLSARAQVKSVFGEPIIAGDKTIIPVAKIGYGFGGGTGSVGIEALSRGASRAIFAENSRAAIGVLRENLKSLGLEGRAEVRQGKAAALIGRITADIVFLDPPYELHSEYETALAKLGEIPPGLIIAQHDARLKLAQAYGALRQTRVLRQGDNCLSFYE